MTRRTRNAAARMRPGPAHVVVRDRSPIVTAATNERPGIHQLVEPNHGRLEDVATRQVVVGLPVERRQHAATQDVVLDVGGVPAERVHDTYRPRLSLWSSQVPFGQIVRATVARRASECAGPADATEGSVTEWIMRLDDVLVRERTAPLRLPGALVEFGAWPPRIVCPWCSGTGRSSDRTPRTSAVRRSRRWMRAMEPRWSMASAAFAARWSEHHLAGPGTW